MKTFLISVLSFCYLTLLSALLAVGLMWLSSFIFVSSWLKVVILLVFAFAFVEWIFDLIAPTLSISPFAHVNPKRAKSAHFAAAVPPILLGVFFLVRFWQVFPSILQFDAKDWVTSIAWTIITANLFWHLAKGHIYAGILRSKYAEENF